MSESGNDKRRCAVCRRLLSEVEAEGGMTTTLGTPHSGKSTHICSTTCWKKAMKKLGI